MDSPLRENIFDELTSFDKKRSQGELSPVLEDYLLRVARTGDPMFPWQKVKPLILYKMEKVFTEFYELCPTDDLPSCPNVDHFDYPSMRQKLIEKVDSFCSSAPFTIQRLCELITGSRRHYKRTDKFMRAVEKTVLVVSTIEPFHQNKKNENPFSPLVNGGVDGSLLGGPLTPTSNVNDFPEVESSDREAISDVSSESEQIRDTFPLSDTELETDVITSSRDKCKTTECLKRPLGGDEASSANNDNNNNNNNSSNGGVEESDMQQPVTPSSVEDDTEPIESSSKKGKFVKTEEETRITQAESSLAEAAEAEATSLMSTDAVCGDNNDDDADVNTVSSPYEEKQESSSVQEQDDLENVSASEREAEVVSENDIAPAISEEGQMEEQQESLVSSNVNCTTNEQKESSEAEAEPQEASYELGSEETTTETNKESESLGEPVQSSEEISERIPMELDQMSQDDSETSNKSPDSTLSEGTAVGDGTVSDTAETTSTVEFEQEPMEED